MRVKINLLDHQRKEILAREIKVRKFAKYLVVSGSVVGVMFCLVLGTRLWLGRRVSRIESEIVDLEGEILGYEDLARKSQVVSKKMAAVAVILPKRDTLKQKLEMFTDVYLKSMEVTSVDFNGAGDPLGLLIGGRVKSVVEMIDLDGEMLELAEGQGLDRLDIARMNRTSEGEYLVDYLMLLDEKVRGKEEGKGG